MQKKTFKNIFSSWLKTADVNRRWFTQIFLKILLADPLFPSYLLNGLILNYFQKVVFSGATSSEFRGIPGWIGGRNRETESSEFCSSLPIHRPVLQSLALFVPALLLVLDLFLLCNNCFLHWYTNTEMWTEPGQCYGDMWNKIQQKFRQRIATYILTAIHK